jgi:hypothetical protein
MQRLHCVPQLQQPAFLSNLAPCAEPISCQVQSQMYREHNFTIRHAMQACSGFLLNLPSSIIMHIHATTCAQFSRTLPNSGMLNIYCSN